MAKKTIPKNTKDAVVEEVVKAATKETNKVLPMQPAPVMPLQVAIDLDSMCKSVNINIGPIGVAVVEGLIKEYSAKGPAISLGDMRRIVGTIANSQEFKPFVDRANK